MKGRDARGDSSAHVEEGIKEGGIKEQAKGIQERSQQLHADCVVLCVLFAPSLSSSSRAQWNVPKLYCMTSKKSWTKIRVPHNHSSAERETTGVRVTFPTVHSHSSVSKNWKHGHF